jgi:hypothetical protein
MAEFRARSEGRAFPLAPRYDTGYLARREEHEPE